MRSLLGALALTALALPACAEEITSTDLSPSYQSTTASNGAQYLSYDRPGLGLPNVSSHVFDLDTRPPLHGYQIPPRSVSADPPKYTAVLIPRLSWNPWKVSIAFAPGYSNFNINTGGSNNAFGGKVKLSAIGKLTERWTLGVFASFEAETEQFAHSWTPSSQAGVAGFLAYEILPKVFVGGAARTWVSYDHLFASRPVDHTTMAGATIAWKFDEDAILALAYTPQVSKDSPRAGFSRQSRFNADVFDNHPLGFKLKFRF